MKHRDVILRLSVGISLSFIALMIVVRLWVRLYRKKSAEDDKEYRKPELDVKDIPKPLFEKDSEMLHEMDAERVRGTEHELDTTRSPVEAEGFDIELVHTVEGYDDAGQETTDTFSADVKDDLFVRYA